MKIKSLFLVLLFSTTLLSQPAIAQYHGIYNIAGYTHQRDGTLKQFSALIFKDGKVVKTGDQGILKQYPKAKLIDGLGKTLLPGLIDAHGHIIGLGKNLSELDLRGTRSIEEIGKKLAQFASNQQGWIIGRGWNQENWQNNAFPTAKDLDSYVKNKPVVLSRIDGHAVWLNSKAMLLAGINTQSKAPYGGEIIKLTDGTPSGILIDNAEQLVLSQLPKASTDHLAKQLEQAASHLLALGITSVHDAGINYDTYQLYRQKAQNNTLPIRIYAMLSSSDPQLDTMLRNGKVQDPNDFLSIRSIKVYTDGALGSRGAALLSDYADRPEHQGLMLKTQQQLYDIFTKSIQAGFSVNSHAIGDRANQNVLDTYAKVYQTTGGKFLRNRIEHAQIVNPQDIPRFKALNIIPSMQPVHATSDMHMAQTRLGESRLTGAYAWQSFLKQGSKVAAGSDFPVELANPFDGLYAAVTRQDKKNQPHGGWQVHETLTKEQALKAFTLDSAYAAHQEFKIGSLEKGKWADFILIDKNYFKVPAHEIHQIKVMQTWIAGKQVFNQE